MDTAMPQEKLREVLDRITREVTAESVGIELVQGDAAPEEDMCTVHISFKRGFRSGLSLCADSAMLKRLTQSFLQEEEITPQDVEDVTKEYFNILCGRIAAALFQATSIASRFSAPNFYQGRFSPEDFQDQFVLNYSNEQCETIQLTHHIPVPPKGPEGKG